MSIPIIVFIATLAVTGIVLSRLLRTKRAGNTSNPGDVWGFAKSLWSGKNFQIIAIVAGIAILFWAWDFISNLLVDWFPKSDAGKTLGVSGDFIRSYLWIIPVVAVLWWWARSHTSEYLTQIVSAFVGAIAFIFIIYSLITDETMTSNLEKKYELQTRASCTTSEEMRSIDIDEVGRDIILCKESGPLYLFPKYGKQLHLEFSPAMLRGESGHLVAQRSLQDFAWINPPKTYPGSLASQWRIVPRLEGKDGRSANTSGWALSGLDVIKVHVYAR